MRTMSARDTMGRCRVPVFRRWLATAASASAVPEVAITFLTRARDDAGRDAAYLAGDESLQAFEFALARRIVTQEFVGESHCAQGQTYSVANVSAAWRP